MKPEVNLDLVLDCSVVMAWCFEDEVSPYSEKIFNQFKNNEIAALVPTIWPYEVANVLLIAERKKRLTHLMATEFKEALNMLNIKIDSESMRRPMGSVYELAKETHLTIYDAAYLELAMRNNIPIASLDNELVKAARKVGISLYSS